MKSRVVRIGSRASQLALAQAKLVQKRLQKKYPKLKFKVIKVRTAGDVDQSTTVLNEKLTGIFTREIEHQLLKYKIDIAVHSLKDLPTTLPKGLGLSAYLKRDNPSDVLITRSGQTLKQLKALARVGTSSPRRERQLLRQRCDLRIVAMRGNITTRIRKVRIGAVDAIVLAHAGLRRIGFKSFASMVQPLSKNIMLPCVGQGVIGLESRTRDTRLNQMLKALNHTPSEIEARAERALLRRLRGGCRVPIGVRALCHKRKLTLAASVFSTKSLRAISGQASGRLHQPERVGDALAQTLLRRGAKDFLNEARAK